MKRFVFAVVTAALALSSTAFAHEYKLGDLVIGHPWTRATPNGAAVGVGYLKLTNNGKSVDRLKAGTFDGSAKVEIHEMKMDGDNMMMRELTDGMEIKPGETVEFKPSSFHLMFTGLTKAIADGPNVKGSLTFEKAGTVDIEYKVEPIGASESPDHQH